MDAWRTEARIASEPVGFSRQSRAAALAADAAGLRISFSKSPQATSIGDACRRRPSATPVGDARRPRPSAAEATRRRCQTWESQPSAGEVPSEREGPQVFHGLEAQAREVGLESKLTIGRDGASRPRPRGDAATARGAGAAGAPA